ncbi:metallophosphoesterase family protein [Luteitalea sp.]
MRIIHTSDWHFGAGHEKWLDRLAARRRGEREAAVQQILDYAMATKADYLVVAGDVCDFPEEMPQNIIDRLDGVKRSGCVPVLLFTNAAHDGNRDWWAGTAMGPQRGHPTHRKVEGRGYRLPHTAVFDNVAFAAFDHVPSIDEVSHLQALECPRILLLHAQDGVTERRLEALRSVFSYIACGDCHESKPVIEGAAYYSGSPTFRDLDCIDPGPRNFLDVQLDEEGRARVTEIEIITPLSAVLSFADGGVKVKPHMEAVPNGLPLPEALTLLPETYAYAKVVVGAEQGAQFAEASASAMPEGWVMYPWTNTTRLVARERP